MDALTAAGFHVIAPDMRGYNLSEKPVGVSHYTVDRLAGDIVGLVHAMGYERATIIGHDWGGAVAWATAIRHPQVVERLVVLSSTHPAIMRSKLFTPRQMLKCWYMFFFQLPWVPEWMIKQPYNIVRCLRGTAALPQAFSADDIAAHVDAMHQPGAATATINYYRAALTRRPKPGGNHGFVAPPTLLLWGDRDPVFGVDLLDGIERVGPDVRVHHVSKAGHWPQVESPDEVNEALLAFLSPAGQPSIGR